MNIITKLNELITKNFNKFIKREFLFESPFY